MFHTQSQEVQPLPKSQWEKDEGDAPPSLQGNHLQELDSKVEKLALVVNTCLHVSELTLRFGLRGKHVAVSGTT